MFKYFEEFNKRDDKVKNIWIIQVVQYYFSINVPQKW